MESRSFRVVLGELSSEITYTENGVIQGSKISVTLFLVALAGIVRQIQHPVEIIGYADEWVIHTSDQYSSCTKQRIILNKKKRFQNITGKDSEHAHMQEKDLQPPEPRSKIEWT
jgi:hypothetical protein